jgi:hypothetical protein
MTSSVRQAVLRKAVYSGLPVARVGRGNPEGFADPDDLLIAGSNLTATKAHMLLMACLLKFGSLPPAKNPDGTYTGRTRGNQEGCRGLPGDLRHALSTCSLLVPSLVQTGGGKPFRQVAKLMPS